MEKAAIAAYRFINLLTKCFPNNGARFIDGFLLAAAGNKPLSTLLFRKCTRLVGSVKKMEAICVIADVHIGDALITSAYVSSLRDFFPEARIDYVANRDAESLIGGNPDISELHPVYSSSAFPYPSASETQTIGNLLQRTDYDLIVNLCPFLAKSVFRPGKVLGYFGLATSVARAQRDPQQTSHLVRQSHDYIHGVLERAGYASTRSGFRGVGVYLSEKARAEAEEFMRNRCSRPDRPTILLNTDASTPFTRIPVDLQTEMVNELAELPCRILLSPSRSEAGLEEAILKAMSPDKRSKITVVPKAFSLDTYAALVDRSDVFITGDTGPLHVAAARKFSKSGEHEFRNKTAVFSVFAATPPRIYGYDSGTAGFLAANQDAPSRAYAAPSPYRNLAYVVKSYIAAKPQDFFDGLETKQVIADAKAVLGFSETPPPESISSSSETTWKSSKEGRKPSLSPRARSV